jgi:hypothetical protein
MCPVTANSSDHIQKLNICPFAMPEKAGRRAFLLPGKRDKKEFINIFRIF